jgi:hypothetical protein
VRGNGTNHGVKIRSLLARLVSGSSAARGFVGSALGACIIVALLAPTAHAQPPQVSLYLNNYGPAPTTPATAPGQQVPASAGAAYQGGAALAQVAAYQQYLTYLALAREGALGPNPGPNPAQYFTNGAAVMTVPSSGQPGSAYFSNGAEATRLPAPASAAAAAASASASPPPAASALPPYWWTGATTATPAAPPPAPAPAPAAVPAPPPAPASAEATTEGPVMSFEEWLLSMGARPEAETPQTPPEVAAEETEAPVEAPIAVEPAAAAFEVRPRVSYAPPEKARERAETSSGSKGLAAFVLGAFAVGLLLGGLAMWRAGLGMGPPGGAASG